MILAIAVALGCHAVTGDQITGKDLAAANAGFSSVAPDAVIGATPIPGVRRVLHPEELLRLARAHHIDLPSPVSEMCFERATHLLSIDLLLPILHKALGLENAKIEIDDFSRLPVPDGDLEFTRAGLSANGYWRGRAAYSDHRSVPIWAKVRVTTEQSWVEAGTAIPPSRVIAADQLILRTGPRFPFGPSPIASIDAAIGKKTSRAIRPGEPIFSNMLIAPHDVERGEKVDVEVSVGEALITFAAVAETAGRIGETVLLRNPENDRYFQARIESRGKVSIRK
jgi:flagella basal body P-ring formation protein FlgA